MTGNDASKVFCSSYIYFSLYVSHFFPLTLLSDGKQVWLMMVNFWGENCVKILIIMINCKIGNGNQTTTEKQVFFLNICFGLKNIEMCYDYFFKIIIVLKNTNVYCGFSCFKIEDLDLGQR